MGDIHAAGGAPSAGRAAVCAGEGGREARGGAVTDGVGGVLHRGTAGEQALCLAHASFCEIGGPRAAGRLTEEPFERGKTHSGRSGRLLLTRPRTQARTGELDGSEDPRACAPVGGQRIGAVCTSAPSSSFDAPS